MKNVELIKAVANEFQKFGFKAQNVKVEHEGTGKYKNDVYIFEKEDPTGQSAFSQKSVQCSFRDFKNGYLELNIHYTHTAGGSNGYSVPYVVIQNEVVTLNDKEKVIKIIPNTLYKLVIENFNKRS